MTDELFLSTLKHYIETSEVELDEHLGTSRKISQLIDANKMPPIYGEVLRRLEAARGDTPSPLVEWLEGEFRHACVNDVMRLKESLLLLKVGIEKCDPPELIMGAAIASFVMGLIEKTPPTTVPVDRN